MITMVKKENGKQEAEQGFHDDKVMSVAIAYHAVGQVLFEEPVKEKETNFFDNWYKEEPISDYGEVIQVIQKEGKAMKKAKLKELLKKRREVKEAKKEDKKKVAK